MTSTASPSPTGGHARRAPFGTWLAAATLSSLGDAVSFFALGWTAAGFGPHDASVVLTAEGLPLCLVILVGGAVADRYGVRRVMACCDAAMALVMVLLAVAALHGLSWGVLVAAAGLSGTAAALRRPAESVFPRLFAEGEELPRRMAQVSAALQVARLAGPTVGGVLVALGGLATTSALDAVTFLAVLAVLLAVRPPLEPTVAAPDRVDGRGLGQAARAAWRAPGIPPTLLAVAGLAASVLPLVMLCVPLAGRDRGWGPGGTGAVAAAWLVGTLVTTLLVARSGAPPPRAAAAGPVLAGAGVVLLAGTEGVAAAVLAQAVVGVGVTLLTSHLLPAFVAASPPHLLARFQALVGLAQTGPVLLANPLLGVLADRVDVGAALVSVAALLLATTVPAAVAVRTVRPTLPPVELRPQAREPREARSTS